MRPWLRYIPEAYFVLSVTYYWIMTGNLFNPYALVLLAALAGLLIGRYRALGVLLGLLFILVDLFLFAALISEYREFHEPTQASQDLILYGSIYLGLNTLMALVLCIKYMLPPKDGAYAEPELS